MILHRSTVSTSVNRRRFLRALAGTGTLGLAGCGDSSSGESSPARSTPTAETDRPPGTASPQPDEIPATPDSRTQTPVRATRTPVGIPPVARISATPTEGPAPLTVRFDGSASTDPDGEIVRYNWLFKDMRPPRTGPVVEHTFTSAGTTRAVELVVVDDTDETARATVDIHITSSDG
jgi:PKD repeat protein